MFHMGAGDKEGIRCDIVILPICPQGSAAKRNVMDLVAAPAMAVGRNGACEAFLDDIQRVDLRVLYDKVSISV